MNRPTLVLAMLAMQLGNTGTAQSTVPHWPPYFAAPGSARACGDHAVVVRRGPCYLVTIAGHTTSNGLYPPGIPGPGLATSGAFQTTNNGSTDAFVARFDPSQAPGQQLLWCTYV